MSDYLEALLQFAKPKKAFFSDFEKAAPILITTWVNVLKKYVSSSGKVYGSVPLDDFLQPIELVNTGNTDDVDDLQRSSGDEELDEEIKRVVDWFVTLKDSLKKSGIRARNDDIEIVWANFLANVKVKLANTHGKATMKNGIPLFHLEGVTYGLRFVYKHGSEPTGEDHDFEVVLFWRNQDATV